MCVIQRGLVSETEGDNMTSEAGHRGGGSQLYPNQGFLKIKAAGEDVLSHLQALFRILSSSIWELLFLYSMAFMLTHAHGEEQTGICKLMDPAIDLETLGLCPCSSSEQLPMKWMDVCIPGVHLNVENHSPDPLGPPSPSRADLKVVAVIIFATIGGIGLAGRMLYKRCRAFTEADINVGLTSEPAVPKRSDPTFEIHPSIE